jgi:PiT family inorganic phosphate transporter
MRTVPGKIIKTAFGFEQQILWVRFRVPDDSAYRPDLIEGVLPMLTSLLSLSVCFLAYANGVNDNFKGVASLFGSGAASFRQALVWSSLTTFAGSIASLFLAQTLLVKFSGKGLTPDALIHTLPFMVSIAGGTGMTVILATRYGFLISTIHALLGAMAAGTILATSGNISLAPLLSNFVLPLLLSPLLALRTAGLLYRVLNRWFSPGESGTACVYA